MAPPSAGLEKLSSDALRIDSEGCEDRTAAPEIDAWPKAWGYPATKSAMRGIAAAPGT
jgi:hypothetical protein